MVLFDSGARLGAILKAKLVDLDLQERTLFVTAENQKHKADQLFHLHADTTAVLAKLVEADPVRELLFPWNASESTLFNRYSRILQRAGLPAGRRFKFHALRRTHASLVSRAAGLEAAQRALGHSSSDLTAESYVDPTQDRTVDLLPRPVRKGVA
jgi:integrase